jgi:AraC-like DNA-binding protein
VEAMKLRYILDISENSTWIVNTPNEISKGLPFYVNEYGDYKAGSTYFTERQKQKNYLLIYTTSGKGYLEYLGGNYILEPNMALIIYCDNLHMYKTYGDCWEFKWFHFNGTSAKEHYKLLNGDGLNIITIKEPSMFEDMLKELPPCFNINDITSNIKFSNTITNIISYLIINRFTHANDKKYTEHKKDIDAVVDYIQKNYSEKVILDDLVKIACMSKFYFLRLFKNHIGVSPYDYLLNYRINKAKKLLRTTELTVGEICSQVGFNDYTHFIREFKKIVGTTPLRYRRNN